MANRVMRVPLLKQPSIECVVFSYLKFIFDLKSKKVWFSHLFRNCLGAEDAMYRKSIFLFVLQTKA
jgi:hypothetical protein